MIRKPLISVLILLTALLGRAHGDRLDVIIITEGSVDSETPYVHFLREVYDGDVLVSVDPDRYDEDLSDKKKIELQNADLIIISRNATGTHYNADASFWNALSVPILCHNIEFALSDDHHFWDWLDGDRADCNPCTGFDISDPNDPVFDGIDTSAGWVEMFTTGLDVDHSDQNSPGNGSLIATAGGRVVIARWSGNESDYYDGSDFSPGGPRLFFATPDRTEDLFALATDDTLLMLRNAILSIAPVIRPYADIDLDGDVDFQDVALMADCWSGALSPDDPNCILADLLPDAQFDAQDVALLAAEWLDGTDRTPPEPNVMLWKSPPETVSTELITMEAETAFDTQHGIQYYFDCVSENGPDSGWQYDTLFEPNGLTPGQLYTYRVKARDLSGNHNETQPSVAASARTYGLYRYIADASAAVSLDDNLVIVGGDEANVLRIYEWNEPNSAPILNVSLLNDLNIEPDHPETDIEGATWLGDRIFWITSHGRNRYGEYRYSRYQFFATTVTFDGPDINVTVDGNYTNLVNDLIAYDNIYDLGLSDAIGVLDGTIDPATYPDLAPKIDGLNIEGLASTPEGDALYIGFRNPRPEIGSNHHALIIRLNNPEEVVLQGQSPQFEPPILLDLGPFGVRSMEYAPNLYRYLIVAGSHKSGAEEPLQILYDYDPATGFFSLLYEFPVLTPEGMFQFPGDPDVHLLSDDGVLLFDTPSGPIENKYLPTEQRTFRTQTVTP